MQRGFRHGIFLLFVTLPLANGCVMFPPTLKSVNVRDMPVIDGRVDPAWESAPRLKTVAKGNHDESQRIPVEIRSVHDAEVISFLIRWEDKTPDETYYQWTSEGRAVEGEGECMPDDQFAIMLRDPEMTFHSCMLTGRPFENDMWHWMAARTNPAGLAEDKRVRIEIVEDAGEERDGNVYAARHGAKARISWPPDEGDALLRRLEQDLESETETAPFTLSAPTGSQADVSARGSWSDGIWTLELARRLDTGHPDDMAIPADRKSKFAISVFDRSEGANHANTRYLKLKLK